MQRQRFAPPIYATSRPSDEDISWYGQDIPASRARQRPRWLRLGAFVLSMVAIGTGLALVWHYSGLRRWSGELAWPAFAAAAPKSASQPEEQLARIVRELDALKKSISDFGAGQQQITASIAALQAGQQELRQRISSIQAGSHWYSDPAALKLRFAIRQKPAAVASAPRAATPDNAARRNDSGPLPLRAPQP